MLLGLTHHIPIKAQVLRLPALFTWGGCGSKGPREQETAHRGKDFRVRIAAKRVETPASSFYPSVWTVDPFARRLG